MNTKKSILLLTILFINSFAFGQWTLCNPDVGYGNSITTIGNTIFYGTIFGIYKSNDNGASWEVANTGLTTEDVNTLFVQGTTLYAGTNGGGIFVSTDLAENWTASNTGLTGLIVKSIAVNDYGLYVGAYDGGVFVSTDEGENWTSVNSGITNTQITAMTVRGNTLFAGSDGSAVFKSDNNGVSWTMMNSGLVSWFIKSLYTMDDKVFAGTLGGLFRLDENSSSFINVNGIIQWAAVLSFCHDGPMLYVGADGGGVYYSLDYGNSWAQWNDGLPNFNIHSLGIYNSKIFAGTCCGFGLWKRPVLPFTGIDLISRHNEIIVYPDPAKDVINVEISFQNLSTDAQISIYNMAGLLVKQQRFLYGKARIDIGDLVNGHYLIGTQDKYKVSVSKFEKVK